MKVIHDYYRPKSCSFKLIQYLREESTSNRKIALTNILLQLINKDIENQVWLIIKANNKCHKVVPIFLPIH